MASRLKIKRSVVAGNRPASDAANAGEPYVNFADLQFGVSDVAAGDPQDLLAVRIHSNQAAYEIADVVLYQGEFYSCVVPHTAKAFDHDDWDALVSDVGIAINFTYIWSARTSGDPGNGRIGINNASPPAATSVLISKTDNDGNDVGFIWDSMVVEDIIGFQEDSGDRELVYYQVTAALIDNGTYFEIPAMYVGGGGDPDDNRRGAASYIPAVNNQLPPGGNPGDILSKASTDNYDTEWVAPTVSGGRVDTVVGTADRIAVDSTDPVNPIVDIDSAIDPQLVPSGGTTDQVLAKNSGADHDLKWGTPVSGGQVDSVVATAGETTVDNTDPVNPIIGIDPAFPVGGQVDSVSGTTNRITVNNADPVNPIVDIDSAIDPQLVPSGGSTDQVLAKNSGADHDLKWGTPVSGGQVDSIVATAGETTVDSTDPVNPIVGIDPAFPVGGQVDSISGTAGEIDVSPDPVDPVISLSASIPPQLVPSGGTTGQGLLKNSNTSYDFDWLDLPTYQEPPPGGATGQVLKKNSGTNYDYSWQDDLDTTQVPTGGTAGQILTKQSATNYDSDWADPAAGGIMWQVANVSLTAVAGNGYIFDTTAAARTLTLPASPAVGDIVELADYDGTFGTNNLTVARNGNNIMGLAEDMICDVDYQAAQLVYADASQGWVVTGGK